MLQVVIDRRPKGACDDFGDSSDRAHSFFDFDFAADAVIALSNADVNRNPSIKNGAT
jgi:hypothetical protein